MTAADNDDMFRSAHAAQSPPSGDYQSENDLGVKFFLSAGFAVVIRPIALPAPAAHLESAQP
jgi:hypothetical protein